jgi:hypothetical protein
VEEAGAEEPQQQWLRLGVATAGVVYLQWAVVSLVRAEDLMMGLPVSVVEGAGEL